MRTKDPSNVDSTRFPKLGRVILSVPEDDARLRCGPSVRGCLKGLGDRTEGSADTSRGKGAARRRAAREGEADESKERRSLAIPASHLKALPDCGASPY
ncbi:hypothetical protein T265_08825 [Opisthorchis viverrini]|uniref:Uncharacterized protein n=1 Tax=Opisthorchis viverrini TaxID=6198 RepID=A0A075A743_OPIVI|nr:hypothetical protein T265_08825 [Opisthorchis viverrini]KER23254.1 hypothetical protein T265_08825 [Opisthorchis viverrini]